LPQTAGGAKLLFTLAHAAGWHSRDERVNLKWVQPNGIIDPTMWFISWLDDYRALAPGGHFGRCRRDGARRQSKADWLHWT